MVKRSFRKRKEKRKGGRTRKQKMYNMKGCSKSKSKRRMSGGEGCGSYGCPIAPFSWKEMQQQGGSCGTCNQSGGNHFYKPPAPIPGPFVGQSWTPKISGWPGVNGIGGDSNYLAQNLYNHGDPQTMMKLGGSRRNKSKRINRRRGRGRGIKGGGLVPQDVTNLVNDMSFNFKSAYNALSGYAAPTNPLPYRDQLSGSNSISAYKALV
jgi:hypothetical protein